MLFGGIITQELSWRWVLLINPPIGIATALIAYAVVADRAREAPRRASTSPGAVTLTVGQMVLVYGIVQRRPARLGTRRHALVPIVVGLGLLALFALIESRLASDRR